jgi:NADPH-dependent 2,4-dienoyl-CoA reductase/sulfur reductase-like enzyme
MKKRILVVGGVAGGATAAARAARTDPDAEVVLFDEDEHISYAACGIPYCMAQGADCQQLVARTAEQLERGQGLKVLLRHRALSIDADRRLLRLRDLEAGREREEPYDKLVIATGASAVMPPLEGREARGVFVLRTLAHGKLMTEFIKNEAPRRAAVVGAGPIGLEMCEAFSRLGMEVTLVELAPEVLPALPPDLAAAVNEHLESHGIRVLTETRLLGILTADGAVKGLSTDKGDIRSDLVLLSVGIRPSVDLASTAGVELGAKGAIRVDRRMRTSRQDIFAAGDCCTARHLVSGEEVWIPLGSTSRKQGRVAGANAAGKEETFPGILGTFILKCFEMAAGATGLDEERARAAGFKPVTVTVEGDAVPAYYAQRGKVRIRLVADAEGGRLLGAQLTGDIDANVDKRLDVLATAVAAGMTASELEALDLAYAPPFSHAVDLPLVAGTQAVRLLAPRPGDDPGAGSASG